MTTFPQFGMGSLGLGYSIENTGLAAHAFASSGDVVGYAMVADTSNAITNVRFTAWKSAGTSPTYRASLQALDANGTPDGTVLGGGSPASVTFTVTSATPVVQDLALSNSYTPSAGDKLAVVVEYSSGTIDFSNYVSFAYSAGSAGGGRRSQDYYALTTSFGTTTKHPGLSLGQAKTASERYGGLVVDAANAASFGYATKLVSTTGHRVACKFTIPSGLPAATVDVIGFLLPIEFTAAQTVTFGIWNAAGTALLSLASVDTDRFQTGGPVSINILFDSAYTASPGDVLYCGVQSVSGSNAEIGILDCNSTTDRDAVGALTSGANMIYSEWNGSSWTDSAADVPPCELLVSAATANSGGGGRQGLHAIEAGAV